MESLTVSAEVDAPIWRVFQNWRRLERFPEFMPSVRESRWLSKTRLHWKEVVGADEYAATFEVITNLRENSVTWRSLAGPDNSGRATCEALPNGRTRLALTVSFKPDAASNDPEEMRRRHEEYLAGFKRFVERK